jgi:hypothetical protein
VDWKSNKFDTGGLNPDMREATTFEQAQDIVGNSQFIRAVLSVYYRCTPRDLFAGSKAHAGESSLWHERSSSR